MRFVFLITLLSLSPNAYSQSNRFVEFSDITNYVEEILNEEPIPSDLVVLSSNPGFSLIVKNKNEFRNLSHSRREDYNQVFKTTKLIGNIDELYTNEVLIETTQGEYWIPIQTSLEKYWREELKFNDKALILIRLYGLKQGEGIEYLFTINSFYSNYYDGLWEEALEGFNNNEDENALNYLNKLIEIDPNDGRNYSMLGYYYYDKGFPSDLDLILKADSLFDKAIELSPDYGLAYYQKAITQLRLDHYDNAWYFIDKAREFEESGIESEIINTLESKLSYSTYLKNKK